MRSINVVAGVAELHDIGSIAVLAFPAETDTGIRLEIVARGINDTLVDDGKLVARGESVFCARTRPRNSRRDVLCGRDAVANIAILHGVGTRAGVVSEDDYK